MPEKVVKINFCKTYLAVEPNRQRSFNGKEGNFFRRY